MEKIWKVVVGIAFLILLLIARWSVSETNFTVYFFVGVAAALILLAYVVVSTTLAAASVYRKKKEVGLLRHSSLSIDWNPKKRHVLMHSVISYLVVIYLFSLAFIGLSKGNHEAFSQRIADLGTALYFSIVTVATVGYGDIVPQSGSARLLVSTEILVGIGFGIFLFSIVANFLRERDG